MKMYTHAANTMREIEMFVNQKNITKDMIISIIHADGLFIITYFDE